MCFEILAHLLRDKSATVDLRWGLTFKGNNFAGRVHDGAVGRDGATDGVVGISQINDDNLSLFTNLLSYTDELVRFHCKRAKSNVGWVDPQVLELAYEEKTCFNGSHWHTVQYRRQNFLWQDFSLTKKVLNFHQSNITNMWYSIIKCIFPMSRNNKIVQTSVKEANTYYYDYIVANRAS